MLAIRVSFTVSNEKLVVDNKMQLSLPRNGTFGPRYYKLCRAGSANTEACTVQCRSSPEEGRWPGGDQVFTVTAILRIHYSDLCSGTTMAWVSY